MPDIQEWKTVSGLPLYEVNIHGQVRNVKTGRLLKMHMNVYGYMAYVLRGNDKGNTRFVHKLIAEAFLPRPEGKTEINHKDLNRSNYAIENLEWVTSSENKQHAIRMGGGRGYPVEKQLAILTYEGCGHYSQPEVAKLFKVSRKMVQSTKRKFQYAVGERVSAKSSKAP